MGNKGGEAAPQSGCRERRDSLMQTLPATASSPRPPTGTIIVLCVGSVFGGRYKDTSMCRGPLQGLPLTSRSWPHTGAWQIPGREFLGTRRALPPCTERPKVCLFALPLTVCWLTRLCLPQSGRPRTGAFLHPRRPGATREKPQWVRGFCRRPRRSEHSQEWSLSTGLEFCSGVEGIRSGSVGPQRAGTRRGTRSAGEASYGREGSCFAHG